MYTIMNSSVSSTLVTVCAFRRSCFLIKVSMSTSVPFEVLLQSLEEGQRVEELCLYDADTAETEEHRRLEDTTVASLHDARLGG